MAAVPFAAGTAPARRPADKRGTPVPADPQAPARPRRSDAGQARLTERDITGLLLVAEQYAAPYDLLGQALGVTPARVRAITARWRGAGYAVTGVLGPGPA
jgi:hypothetical protein